jgi:hypothetical protein
MNVEPPETLVIIESIVYKSNGFAIFNLAFEASDENHYPVPRRFLMPRGK